ncbi:hypothetical protein MRX96_038663 [Rhipicephalus microplus]
MCRLELSPVQRACNDDTNKRARGWSPGLAALSKNATTRATVTASLDQQETDFEGRTLVWAYQKRLHRHYVKSTLHVRAAPREHLTSAMYAAESGTEHVDKKRIRFPIAEETKAATGH